mmetsp:Transcript_52833/g.103315  ORF Transcript_52833/g.103315 Transcript_52833/m.103315 type:complete len:182 (+) Transcript_52833:118-663(+)
MPISRAVHPIVKSPSQLVARLFRSLPTSSNIHIKISFSGWGSKSPTQKRTPPKFPPGPSYRKAGSQVGTEANKLLSTFQLLEEETGDLSSQSSPTSPPCLQSPHAPLPSYLPQTTNRQGTTKNRFFPFAPLDASTINLNSLESLPNNPLVVCMIFHLQYIRNGSIDPLPPMSFSFFLLLSD